MKEKYQVNDNNIEYDETWLKDINNDIQNLIDKTSD